MSKIMIATMIDFLPKILPYIVGGLGGSVMTISYNRWYNKIKKMKCYYVNDDTITRIPTITESGEQHNNIFSKEFCLTNTTGKDIVSFKIIFEFDASSKILKHDTYSKTGKNDVKSKNKKLNECCYTIKNFNRNDKIQFFFDIANVTNDHYNVTEADCIGFKIVVKDRRKPTIKNKSKVVQKAELN